MKLPKHADLWLPSYVRGRMHRRTLPPARRVWLALTDHYEPMGGKVTLEVGRKRVDAWRERWPEIAHAAPKDSQGKPPRFTAFYPQEEYEPELLHLLAGMTHDGTMDVEVHLHHFNDNAVSLAEKLRIFKRQLREDHGLLHVRNGEVVFGFIHGNWALDNSHPTGFGCGVQGELQVLRQAGCYADFTMPSLPSPTQSRIVNQIYWTNGPAEKPRGFDVGTEASVGGGRQGELLMVEGPSTLRFRDRLLPRIETGELAHYDLPTAYRVQRWLDVAPRIGEDLFLKLYGHSAREDNAAALLGSGCNHAGLSDLFRLVAEAAEQRGLELHWASAYEMFERIDSLLEPPLAAASLAKGEPA